MRPSASQRSRPASSAERHPRLLACHVLALASGALCLVYELLWMRRFAVLFGATAPAAAVTLSAIFLGLALGSAVLGRLSARARSPLAAFGLLEVGIGITALLVGPILGLYESVYPRLYGALGSSPHLFLTVKALLSTAAVLPPAFLMGGTLPLLGQAVTAGAGRLGLRTARLFAVNTLGAAGGALVVPFLLLPALGSTGSHHLAVAGSVAVGIAALALGIGSRSPAANRRPEESPVAAPSPGEQRVSPFPDGGRPRGSAARSGASSSAPLGRRPLRAIALLSFGSGLLGLGQETLSTRLFALVHGNSLHAFAVVLAAFLAGLSAGALLTRALLRRGSRPAMLLAVAWIGGGLALLISPRLFHELTHGMEYLAEGGAAAEVRGTLLVALLVLLPPALFSGATLPLLVELAGAAGASAAGPAMGWVLALNTAGAVLGPYLATFLAVPALGLPWSFAACGLAMLAAAEFTRRAFLPPSRRAGMAVAALSVVAALLLLGTVGLPRVRLDERRGERLLSLREGALGTVAVVEDGAHRAIKLNNSYLIGGTLSTEDERLQGHLPLLLHPTPRRVAFLGMGTGITAGAALLHPVEKVTVLEIVPEVIQAARDHFAAENLGLVGDARVEVVAEDARNFLLGSGRTFDVVVGDLVVPWRPGEASLYTREHFQAARRSLEPGGLFCQWVPLFQLGEDGFRAITAAFLDVFPHATLWRGDFFPDQPALALIASRDDEALDPSAIERRRAELAPRLERTSYLSDPAGLWLFLIGAVDAADPAYASAPRNSDDHPRVELRPHPPARSLEERGAPGRLAGTLSAEARAKRSGSTPLVRLEPRHLAWVDAGAELERASVLLLDGREDEYRRTVLHAVDGLPASLRAVILGGGPEEAGGSPDPGR